MPREYYLTEHEIDHLRDGGGVRVAFDDGVEVVLFGPADGSDDESGGSDDPGGNGTGPVGG